MKNLALTFALFAASAFGMEYMVMVGGKDLVYSPTSVSAKVGDKITFQFKRNNHTATQSTFDKPCVKMAGGLDSGFMPNVNDTVVPPPTFSVDVKSLEPMWFYCKQRTGTHCGKGMVFAINPTQDKSFETFKSMAIQQNGTASVTTGATASATSTAVTLVAAPPGAATSAPIAIGAGQAANGNTCVCQCLCAVGQFPAGAGLGSYGGFPG
ncbi:MAG: hypothetical protein M1839_008722 [Geoglossum umbratile]|nr:MAG: hypothetical protein M1839_008722 [Geoglossum umbratile]